MAVFVAASIFAIFLFLKAVLGIQPPVTVIAATTDGKRNPIGYFIANIVLILFIYFVGGFLGMLRACSRRK